MYSSVFMVLIGVNNTKINFWEKQFKKKITYIIHDETV
jgi:hypothetical protein